jgi:hypothetical protein
MAYTTIQVPAQTDPEYSSISSNQCSWAAYEFVKNSTSLRLALYKNNREQFLEIYRQCLHDASHLRKNTTGCLYGENIDTPIIKEHYSKSVDCVYHSGVYQNEDPEFISILHEDLRREFYTRKYHENSTENIINGAFGTRSCLLVSRHGQSFAIIPYYGRYLICDSHLHESVIVSKDDAIKHMCMDYGGHLHVTIMQVII